MAGINMKVQIKFYAGDQSGVKITNNKVWMLRYSRIRILSVVIAPGYFSHQMVIDLISWKTVFVKRERDSINDFHDAIDWFLFHEPVTLT